MLFADVTGGAIVAGVLLNFAESELSFETANAIRNEVRRLEEEFGLGLKVFVAGDTDTSPDFGVQNMVLGIAAVEVECWEPPRAFQAETIRAALDAFPGVPQEYLTAIQAISPLTDGFEPEVQPLLMSWGPLPYASIAVGVASTEDEALTYTYIANQDMDQEWTEEGLDGKSVSLLHPDGYDYFLGVEFSDVLPVPISKAHVEEYFKLVPDLENPSLFLTCRYD